MSTPPPRASRPSGSADAVRQQELAYVESLTPRERILLALRLGQRGRRLAAYGVDRRDG